MLGWKHWPTKWKAGLEVFNLDSVIPEAEEQNKAIFGEVLQVRIFWHDHTLNSRATVFESCAVRKAEQSKQNCQKGQKPEKPDVCRVGRGFCDFSPKCSKCGIQ